MLKIAVKTKLLNDKMKKLIQNSPKNIINLDTDNDADHQASDDPDPIDN